MRKNSAVFTALGTGTRGTVLMRVPNGGSPPPFEVHDESIPKSAYNGFWLDSRKQIIVVVADSKNFYCDYRRTDWIVFSSKEINA